MSSKIENSRRVAKSRVCMNMDLYAFDEIFSHAGAQLDCAYWESVSSSCPTKSCVHQSILHEICELFFFTFLLFFWGGGVGGWVGCRPW